MAEDVKSVLLYAPVWADCKRYKTYTRSISFAYRTVYDEAALVVAGMVPIDLLAKERMYVYIKIFNAREKRVLMNARWTHMLIPDNRIWLQRKHGGIDFYISQLLTGHGCLLEYLHHFGIAECHSARYARILPRVQGMYFLIALDSVFKGPVLIDI